MSSPGRTSIKARAKANMKEKEAPPARVPILRDGSLEAVAEYIKQGKAKNIIVMAGAGISTAAGIKDFRSPGTGLYSDLAKYNLPYPEAVFDIDFFKKKPAPFYRLAKELYPGRYRPTLTHYFFRLLVKKNLLLRIYTQNIDSLERQAGIDGNMLVEAHGSFASSKCIQCGIDNVDPAFVKKHILKGEIPYCKRCGGLVKPAITFFGEDLPARFGMFRQDFPECDLLIVLGTSLKVEPFNRLTAKVKDNVPRLLINREKAGEDVYGGFDFDGKWSKKYQRDAFFGGDCDSGVRELAKLLGWEDQLDAIYEDGHAKLKLAEEQEALELAAEGLRAFQDEDDETDEDRDDEPASQDSVVGKAEAELPVGANNSSTEKVAEAIDLIVSQLQQSSLTQSSSSQGEEKTNDGTSDQPTVAKTGAASKPDKKTKDHGSAAVIEESSSPATQAAQSSKADKEEAKGSCGLAEPKSAVEYVNTLSAPAPAPAPAPAFVQTPIQTPASVSTVSSSAVITDSKATSINQSFDSAYTPLPRPRATLSSTPVFNAGVSRRVSCPPKSPWSSSSLPSLNPSSSHPGLSSVRHDKSPRPHSSVFLSPPTIPSPTTQTTITTTASTTATVSIASIQPTASPLKPLFTPTASPLAMRPIQTGEESNPRTNSTPTIYTSMSAKAEDDGPQKNCTDAEAPEVNVGADMSKPLSISFTVSLDKTTTMATLATTTTTATAGSRTRTASGPLTMRPTSSLFPGAVPTSTSTTPSYSLVFPSLPPSFSPSLSRPPSTLSASLSPSPVAKSTNVIANQNEAYPSPSPSPSPKLMPSWTTGGVVHATYGASMTNNRVQESSRQAVEPVAGGVKATSPAGMEGKAPSGMERMEEATTITVQKEDKENAERLDDVTTKEEITGFGAAVLTAPSGNVHRQESSSALPLVLVPAAEFKLDRLFTFTSASTSNGDGRMEENLHQQQQQQQQQHRMTMSPKMKAHRKRLRRHRSDADRLEGRRRETADEGEEEEDGQRRFTLSTPDGSLHPRQRRVSGGLSRHGSLALLSSYSSSSSSSSISLSSSCGPSLRRIKSAFPYLVGGPVHKKRRV
ncbi:NAD-dependent protein deacetylase sirtuin-2 [Actinomortierella ambigua]|nr:NAD-dependent protein deacetylase sirtuin-2 [Actinomortierella ambigua]